MVITIIKLWMLRRLLRWFWRLASYVMAFSPLALAALYIVKRCHLCPARNLLLVFAVAYILMLLLYFLKGVLIALRENKVSTWLPLFVALVLIGPICSVLIVPTLLHLLLLGMGYPFHPAQYTLGYIIFLFASYKRYRLLRPGAPLLAYPSYILGVRLVKCAVGARRRGRH